MRPDVYLRESARTECDQKAALIRIARAVGQGRLPNLSTDNVSLLHGLIGVMNELGELTTLMQKWLWYGKPFTEEELRAKVKDEAGDLLWHLSQVLRRFGLTYEELMEGNIVKLQVRYPDAGWSYERAAEEARDRLAELKAQASGVTTHQTEKNKALAEQYKERARRDTDPDIRAAQAREDEFKAQLQGEFVSYAVHSCRYCSEPAVCIVVWKRGKRGLAGPVRVPYCGRCSLKDALAARGMTAPVAEGVDYTIEHPAKLVVKDDPEADLASQPVTTANFATAKTCVHDVPLDKYCEDCRRNAHKAR